MNAQTHSVDVNKAIRKENSASGQFLVWGLRDLPGRPLMGGPYLAARCYDEYTADLLVMGLKNHAALTLTSPPTMKVSEVPKPPKVERLPAPKNIAAFPTQSRKAAKKNTRALTVRNTRRGKK